MYGMIAEAESHAHGVPVTDIHFHEVGTMDALADISAVCLLLHKLAPEQILASPVCMGSGQVRCAHGILPVPTPATAYLLQGIPAYSGTIQTELCTPHRRGTFEAFRVPLRRYARHDHPSHRLRHGHQGVRRRQLPPRLLGRHPVIGACILQKPILSRTGFSLLLRCRMYKNRKISCYLLL